MKYQIEQHNQNLDISISASPEEQEVLLESYMGHCKDRHCHDGSCKYATHEYQKVDRINIQPMPGGVLLELIAKPGEILDGANVEPCLLHNIEMTTNSG